MCINEPACYDGGPGNAGNVFDVVYNLYEANKLARECGSLNGYQCFLANSTFELGAIYCAQIQE